MHLADSGILLLSGTSDAPGDVDAWHFADYPHLADANKIQRSR
jgi:hypothetical protein